MSADRLCRRCERSEAIQSSAPQSTRSHFAPPRNVFEGSSGRAEDWIASLRSQ
jgi:hypothetical protein